MKNWRNLLLFIALISIAGVIYFIEQPGGQPNLSPIVDRQEGEERAAKVGFLAPDFALRDYDGNVRTLADYEGKKVLLNFWAEWCPFCLEEMPLFEKIYQDFNDQPFEIVAINRGESLEVAKSYTDAMGLTYSLLLDPHDQMYRAYNGRAMPSSYLIDQRGKILDIKFGPYSEEGLRADLKEFFLLGLTEAEKEAVMEKAFGVATPTEQSDRAIQTTGDTKHSVPLEDIRGGGPPKDGIPSIDNPQFVSIKEASEWIKPDGLGIALSLNGIDRFYPNQILVWHEIVNDVVGGTPALVTYCPLCGTGIVFDPVLGGEGVEFGTSGKLWNSNLVMYDRKTDTYWSQVLGEAIVGELTGTKLGLIPYDNVTYEDWAAAHPDGQVLSRKTGAIRNYSRDPYGDYYTTEGFFFPVDHEDDRYFDKEPTWGIEIGGETRVYVLEELLKGPSSFRDEFAGVNLNVEFDKDLRTIDIRRADNGQEVVPFYGFWFSWIAVHPESEVWQP